MVKSKKSVRNSLYSVLAIGTLLFAFKNADDVRDLTTLLKNRFTALYDVDKDAQKLKKFEIDITRNGFFRLRKIYMAGKTEYFSFSLQRFDDAQYWGTDEAGTLVLNTTGDDIIVQTYNDPRGNVDSMATSLKIHLRHVEPEDLNLIHASLQAIKRKLQE